MILFVAIFAQKSQRCPTGLDHFGLLIFSIVMVLCQLPTTQHSNLTSDANAFAVFKTVDNIRTILAIFEPAQLRHLKSCKSPSPRKRTSSVSPKSNLMDSLRLGRHSADFSNRLIRFRVKISKSSQTAFRNVLGRQGSMQNIYGRYFITRVSFP